MLAIQDLSSLPAEFTGYGSDVIFTAQNTDGYELWKYDGSNVSQIANINPTGSSHPSDLTVAGSYLYFVASDGGANFNLWKFDGSAVSKVLDTTGLAPVEPDNLTAVGSTLYFVAEDGINGRELWKTNGTAAGTVMVKDISPADSPFAGPDELVAVGSNLYFIAFDDTNGWELWKSDGSTPGTQLVADINPGEEGSLPQELTVLGSTVYFRADNGTSGEELWKQTGANPPEMVKDINLSGASNPRDLTVIGTKLYFSTKDDTDSLLIWNSDGTTLGTQIVQTLHVGDDWDTGPLVEVAGNLYFSATAPDEQDGWELWKIDGTTLASTLLATFADWGQWADPWTLMEAGGRLYFASWDGTYGHELWTSDGTVAGTKRLTDINFRVGNSSPQFLSDIGGVVYFAANNGAIGIEPYSYDRTGIGLRLLGNIASTQAGPQVSISMAFDSDSGYENDDGITRFTRPTFVVDVNMPGQVQIDFDDNGSFEFSQAVSNWGTYEYTPTPAYASGLHTVTVRFTANSISVEDETEITVDTIGPSLVGTYPVENTTSNYHSLFFDEPINEDRIFVGDFLLSGPGIVTPISLSEFFVNLETDRIDVGFAPLATPGVYTISVNNGLEDLAGNLLHASSPTSVSFEVLANAVFLDDTAPSYVWDSAYDNKDLVVDGTILQVSGTRNLSSLWLLNGAQVVPLAGQPLELIVAGKVVIDETSEINANGLGSAGGGLNTAGTGDGAGAAGTDGGGGGGHGGVGGIGGSTANAAGGVAHGSNVNPVTLGSGGGGSAASTGGVGGGAVKLDVGTELVIDGTIVADGAAGAGVNASGGAGGSIWLLADSIEGDGIIRAEGGDALGLGGGGGGGRVAVSALANQFTGDVSVVGGSGTNGTRTGVVGTIVASPAFPASGAGGVGDANGSSIATSAAVSRDKVGGVKYTVKSGATDRGSGIVKKNTQRETDAKNKVTIKNKSPGSYQVQYKANVRGTTRSLPSTAAFTAPARTGVPSTLSFAVSAQIEFTPTLVWDGGGDGVNWTSALNWSTDVVPTSGDTVSIPAGISPSVTITGTQSVKALFSATNIVLSGSLTVSDVSQVTGAFTMSPGATLTATGPQANFEATGTTVINGANLFASNGGEISLPGVLSWVHAATNSGQVRTWRASGPGSSLSLPNLVSILNDNVNWFNGTSNSHVQIQALNGGVVDLSQVAEIADPPVGTTASNTFSLTADGLGSLIDLSALIQFLDRNSSLSAITATNGGEIRVPALTTVSRTNLVLNKTGIFSVAQLTGYTDGQLTLSGANGAGTEYAFTNLHTITRTTVSVNGVDVALGAVTNANGASFLVEGGVPLTLPGVVSWVHAATDFGQVRTWRASGPGSSLSLPNLVSILNDNVNWFNGTSNSHVQIQALNGGVVDLSQVAEIADPPVGTTASNTFSLTADGLGSLIDLSALIQFLDRNSSLSAITVSSNGAVNAGSGNAVVLQNVSITLSTGGTISGSLNLSTGSSLVGGGTVTGDLISRVTINPAGTITIGGNYTQNQSGILAIEISGHQSTDVDKLAVGGAVSLNGQLQVTRLGGFVPSIGDNYPILTFASSQNDFALKTGLDLGNQKILKPVFSPTNLTLFTTAPSGTGVFVDSGQSLGSTLGREVRLGDVNNDGDLDALVSSDGSVSTNPLWVNNGAGVFSAGSGFASTTVGPALALSDIDNDNDLDVVAGFGASQPLRIYRNQGGLQGGTLGNFTFTAGSTLGTGDIRGVALADLDGDNDRDAFLAITGGGNQVWINQGGAQLGTLGVFLNSGQSLGSLNSVDVVLGDLDNDLDIDAATANSDGSTVIWRNNGAGTFTQIFSAGSAGTFVTMGDIDGDTDLDMLTANSGAGAGGRIIRNLGGGSFSSSTVFTGGSVLDMALGDIDGDGDLDVYAATGSSQADKVWFNTGAGTFVDSLEVLGAGSSHDVALGDLDGDGDLDAFVVEDGPDKVWFNQPSADYGDAPDATYPTLATNSGASHNIVPGYFLGAGVDADADGQPHPFALGDDLNGTDDENGVVFADTLFVGVSNSVSVTASAAGLLDGWIDFNNDGDWNDAGEKPFVSVPLVAGVNALNFVVPSTATATFATFARFRFSSTGGLAPTGRAINGEVEDYFVPIRELDMGDAAANSFATTLDENGARHMIVAGYHLGGGVSAEADGQPNSMAVGDAGDDGVRVVAPLVPGEMATVEVTASAPGLIDAWVDFDDDGQVDTGEQVFVSVLVNAGANQISFSVPASVNIGDVVFGRFRFSSVGGLGVTGFAPNGEVEDYTLAITNGLTGDGNLNDEVDTADYVMWRKSLGTQVPLSGGADHDGDGHVTQSDYSLWRANFGNVLPGSGAAAVVLAVTPTSSVATTVEAETIEVARLTALVSDRDTVRPVSTTAVDRVFAELPGSRPGAARRAGSGFAPLQSIRGNGGDRSRDLLVLDRVFADESRTDNKLVPGNRRSDDQALNVRSEKALRRLAEAVQTRV